MQVNEARMFEMIGRLYVENKLQSDVITTYANALKAKQEVVAETEAEPEPPKAARKR